MSDRNRWRGFWQRIGARGEPLPVHDEFVRAYLQPHRAYHNLRHIDDCLRQLDLARDLAESPDAVEMALWFHDVVYEPRAKDNEEKSAEWARRVGRDAGLAGEFATAVEALILATKHDALPATPDARLIVDIDLSILGRSGPDFDAYEEAIRQEYRWVPDLLFRPGRAKILRAFLARPAIYSTQRFHAHLEQAARKNLERSLVRLGD